MKKIALILLASLFLLCGCSKTYSLPWDQFCFETKSGKEVDLSAEEKKYVIDLMNSGTWEDKEAESEGDFVFHTEKQKVGYSTESGILYDITNKKSLKLSESEWERINGMLNVSENKNTEKTFPAATVSLTANEAKTAKTRRVKNRSVF